ncbi:hypothetical protein JYU34_012694 [Plutella xylostella]|uniref:non-specific serine/threonine protein kinase n=1 Tax=Plutella xylostella TaxID=51655 RepID=A0ABQ7QC87_PLUXY|nr:hypothetical protein JYU34_012694 [Plutella xylostella]
MEVEDDNQEGPFTVWQMFNAPTMVLFNNLEHAADGLDRLLTSILKLSGDFSEVLVPRPNSSKFPDEYYKAFNTWLIGRLFYVWSVKELERIHITSKDAQLKILNILSVNGASFYQDIHSEYFNILQQLSEYYKENAENPSTTQKELANFSTGNIQIPNTQLDLQSIYVTVKDLQTCERLIELTLQLLSDSIPVSPFNTDQNGNSYETLYLLVLGMLENYNVHLKLCCLNFFHEVIDKSDKVSVTKFSENFPEVYDQFMYCLEAITASMPIYHEKGEVDGIYLEKFSLFMVNMLKKITTTLEKRHKQIVATVCTVILNTAHGKVFNKDLKTFCLSLSSIVDLPEEYIDIRNKDSKELYILMEYFTHNIVSCLTNDAKDLKGNSHCQMLLSTVVESMESAKQNVTSHKYDKFLLLYQLNRVVSALTILQNIYLKHQAVSNKAANEKVQLLSEDNTKKILANVVTLHAALKTDVIHDIEIATALMEISVLVATLSQNVSSSTMSQVVKILQITEYSDDIRINALKYYTIVNVILKKKLDDGANKSILSFVSTLTRSKTSSTYKQIISACPILLLKKTFSESKLIAEILLPAFLMKDADIHKELCKVLPILACMSLGNCAVVLQTKEEIKGHVIYSNKCAAISIVCSKCHNTDRTKLTPEQFLAELSKDSIVLDTETTQRSYNDSTLTGQRSLFAKFLNSKIYSDLADSGFLKLVEGFSNHGVFNLNTATDVFSVGNSHDVLKVLRQFIDNISTSLGPKAVVYLRDICEAHDTTPNQVYHRYKKDYCKLFVDCSLYCGKEFAMSLLKVVRAFGFVGYRDFISKDVHHFLPYLIPYSVKIKEVPSIIEEIASLVQCSVSDFLTDRFPHIYTHIYLYENDSVAKKCYDLIERLTKSSILNLIRRHFRIILTEFLLQYCCNPEKVLAACRYLACHDPDVSTTSGSTNMSASQVADFLQPKFLGVLAYIDHKLVNAKVALSVKRKALQSFPDIIKLMGVKYLTPLRYKVLATLRSAMSLVHEFPKILAAAWSAFIHNIDSMLLGPLLSNLAVSLLQQMDHAPHEINKIFQYLVLSNENLLSSHISDLFFLQDSNISEKVKLVIKRHVKRTQPEGFLDKIKWYLQHLNQDIPTIKACAFSQLDKLLKSNRTEIHKAIFGGKTIDPIITELIDCLLTGCKDSSQAVSVSSGSCLGQLGAIEAGHLPRQYVQPDRSPFAFSISDDCFAATALVELTRAFQYEKDTMNMDCYALTIQEILKIYNISPNGKKEIWDSFPEHMHQIMFPLLSSRYTLAYPSQPKKAHPLFGSAYATTFLEWAHNWAGQMIPLIESESIRALVRAVHPSMRRDARTLLLLLPHVLLHAVMSRAAHRRVHHEMQAVIGLENFENANRVTSERSRYKLLRHIRMTPSVSSVNAEEGNQYKCSKMVYTLLDFLKRWLLEWCHSKQHPLQNENYKAISSFLDRFDKLTIARGNFLCGEYSRALQYLELHVEENKQQTQPQLPLLAEIYALLDEPDSVAGILAIKRTEPSLKELILAQVVTGRLQDAALCYERLAQEGQLDRNSLQGMIDCYLGLDQPFTAYRLLSEQDDGDTMELGAEALWRLGRFEELDELAKKPVPPSRENWGLLMGRTLLAYRSQDQEAFDQSCHAAMTRLVSQMDDESKGESALRSGYQSVLGLHIITEAKHAQEVLQRLKSIPDSEAQESSIISELLDEWRLRLCVVQSDVRTVEPLLRTRRILLQQTQELLEPTHPLTASKLKSCIGDLWLQSVKHARKAGIFQQSYMYILNAEEYHPEQLYIEKSKMYWARAQRELAFTSLKRGLDEASPELDKLTQDQR